MTKVDNLRIAIIQARMNSLRFPGKVLKKIRNIPNIIHLLNRVKKAKFVDEIVLATSTNPLDDILSDTVKSYNYKIFRGSEKNVLLRYINCAEKYNGKTIIRITGDCPLIDPEIIDKTVKLFVQKEVDYCSNINPPTYPDGLDVEVVKLDCLKKSYLKNKNEKNREHVTKFIRESDFFTKANLYNKENFSKLRWTLDEQEDFNVISSVYKNFYPNLNFKMQDILKLMKKKPHLFNENIHIKRNEGEIMSEGQKLWTRARKIIPNGNSLLSKNPEMFLPNFWPSYFSKAKGCQIWDLEGKKYIDMSIMGIGTNILGYNNDEVDASVKQTIQNGNMSTFNCPEEVYLAEKLIKLHPWADMVKYARTGGEANAIAVRIARAFTGKDKIAICGYHGWHDWYLAANLSSNKNLDEHLLPGLNTKGVPRNLEETIFPFNFNNYEELENLVYKEKIKIIKMEIFRNFPPTEVFLEKLSKLVNKNNILLIFDECTSGFRSNFGGLHLKYKINPDILILGKALGNGYAITAILGKKDVMNVAQETFISSTFWTERIGPTAALKTLDIMEKTKSWEIIEKKGKQIRKIWRELSKKHNLKIEILGLPALSTFNFLNVNDLVFKTYLTQEMLKVGILASNSIYVATTHTDGMFNKYYEKLDKIFKKLATVQESENVNDILDGPVKISGFKRLN